MEERLEHLGRVMERGFDTLADLQRETNLRLDRHEEVLIKLADGMVALNGRVDSLNGRVDSLTAEVKSLNGRFDNFLTGEHHRDHGELHRRVERLERHLGLAATP
jgi:hypothetical protein